MQNEIEIIPQDSLLTIIESKIESVLNASFKEVGGLLQEVRDQKLYLPKYHSFEEYTQARWNFSRIRAHQLIEGADISEKLLTIVNIPNEAVAREILKTPELQQMKVAKAAMKLAKQAKTPLTAKIVKQAAKKVVPDQKPEPERSIPRGGLYAQMMATKEPKTQSPAEILEATFQANIDTWRHDPPTIRFITNTYILAFK